MVSELLRAKVKGQDIIDVVKKLAKEPVVNRDYINGRDVFILGQTSVYPYKHLIIGVDDGNQKIDPLAVYNEITITEYDWGGGMALAAIGYSQDSVIKAVKEFTKSMWYELLTKAISEQSVEDKKKRYSPIHKAIIEGLRSDSPFWNSVVEVVAFLHGHHNSKCPPEFLSEMIACIETIYGFDCQSNIDKAVINLKTQLKEHELEKWEKILLKSCPNCNCKLERVEQPYGISNEEWNAQKRGDLFCPDGCHRFFLVINDELKPGNDD